MQHSESASLRYRLAAAAMVALVLGGRVARAQAGATSAPGAYVATMTFDVASIHETKAADSYTVTASLPPHTSSIRLQNFSVANLLAVAYGVRMDQMAGLPDWPWPAMFTIVAKSDEAADERLAKLSDKEAKLEKDHMLQALLAARFNLKVHWETREGQTFNLVATKPGRLQEWHGEPPAADAVKAWGDGAVPPLRQQIDGKVREWVGYACPISDLVSILAMSFGGPVNDKTGLTGKYDFVLRYNRVRETEHNADDMDATPTMEDGLQDQLGLKITPAKGPVQVLVIDHIEKPSEN